jgi:cytochrome c oxidase subunit 4
MSGGHSKKEYIVIFFVLTVLTGIEVALKYIPMPRGVLIGALIVLALTKATIVALFYMHLKSETRSLKLVVGIPLMFPALYAVVLIIESIARSAFT